MISYVNSQRDVELRDVSNALRHVCQRNGGYAWLSRRTLCHRFLYRGATRTLELVEQLVELGEIRRVSAPGRGHGRGRTLYWLPATRKRVVLRELKREGMPVQAFWDALRFFALPENGTQGYRSQSLRFTQGLITDEKGSPAAPAKRSRAPSAPKRLVTDHNAKPSAPPSTRRLSKHGSALERLQSDQLDSALERMRRVVRRSGPEP